MIVRNSDKQTEAAMVAVTRSDSQSRNHTNTVGLNLNLNVNVGGAVDIQEEVALQKAMIKQQKQEEAQNQNAKDDTRSETSGTTSPIDSNANHNTVTQLKFVKTIGVGTFGKISVIRMVQTNNKDNNTNNNNNKESQEKSQDQSETLNQTAFALKQVAKSNLFESKRGLESAMTERYILSELNHPFLMNAFDTWQDERYIYFLMNFASGGDLFSKLQKGEILSESRICLYMAEISLALDFLHCQNIIYRDMKAENVLIGPDGHLKLTDFGLSKYCDNAKEEGCLRAYTICGTPEYMAPELIDSDGYGYGQKADWWALGVLMHEMMYGFPPFYSEDPQEACQMILTSEIEFPEYPEFSSQCKHIVSELLIKDEMSRLGNRHIFQHVFFNKFNLEEVYDKQVLPEYLPQLQDPFDCSNFDDLHEDYIEQNMDTIVQVPGFAWRPTTAIKRSQSQVQPQPQAQQQLR